MIPAIRNFRAVAIDLDGTLIDSAHDLAGAVAVLLELYDRPRMSVDQVATLIGGGIAVLVQRVLAESGLNPNKQDLQQAIVRFREIYGTTLFTRSRVFPGVLEGLAHLRKEGLKLACVTNKAAEFTGPLLQAAGLASCFDVVFTPGRKNQRKPSPWMLQQVCQNFNIGPSQLLMVGDSRFDVKAARAAGCFIAAVNYGYNHGQDIALERPDWVISSLADIPTLAQPPDRPLRDPSRCEDGSC